MTEVLRTQEGAAPGWIKVVKMRLGGASAGTVDVYMQSPRGKLLRSKTDLEKYLAAEGIRDVSVDQFDFSKKQVMRAPEVLEALKNIDPSAAPATKKKFAGGDGQIVKKKKKFVEGGERPMMKIKKKKDIRIQKSPEPEKDVKSPYGFFLEEYKGNDWKFMTAACFYERNSCQDDSTMRKNMSAFFDSYPGPKDVCSAGWKKLGEFLYPLGYRDIEFSQKILRFTTDYLKAKEDDVDIPVDAFEAVTPLMSSCYRIFVAKDFQRTKPLDFTTSVYRDWARNRALVQAIMRGD